MRWFDKLRRDGGGGAISGWRIRVGIVVVLDRGGHTFELVAEDLLCSFAGGENQGDRRQADRVYSETSGSLLCFG
jgi:hypothetical protein